MKKVSFIVVFCAFVVSILLLIFLSIYNITSYTYASVRKSAKSIVIDAGHGGPDGGAVASDGTCEKDINLNIAYYLKYFFVASGYKVVLTRTEDSFICDDKTASLAQQNTSDLHNRLKIAQSTPNSIFISIHLNKFPESKYWGAQVFYSPNNPSSRLLGESVSNRIITSLQPDNTRQCKEMDDSVYIIYNATMPAVLVECGFLSNENELKLLKTKEYQQKMAYSIFCGVEDYYKNT